MAISITRYVDIVSGVGGGAAVPRRELIARFITSSQLVPTGSIVEMDTIDDVGDYFGTTSQEYKRAAFYFGFLSKNITKPRKVSYARWADIDVGAQIYGSAPTTTLSAYTAILAGGFTLTLAGVDGVVAGVDLSLAASLADVAGIIQADIRLLGGSFALVTVTFNATANRFEFDSGNTGNETISVTDGVDGLLALMGWTQAGAIFSDGSDLQLPADAVSLTTGVSNNFGSFEFIDVLDESEYVAVATWNQAQNILFMFSVPVNASNAAALSAALIDIGGTFLTLHDPLLDEYPQVLPMAVLAATNYDARSSVQNYMYQQASGLTPLVKNNPDANLYDALRVNYYGQTQTAGTTISFYQRGVLCGGATFPTDMNTYANEMWMKDFVTSLMLGLLLSQARVSANTTGRGQLLTIITEATDLGLLNGTISVGKQLNVNQRIFIADQTGDPLAYLKIQGSGFWVDIQFQEVVVSGKTEYKAVYKLLYSKDDVVRKIEGSHVLI